MKTIKLLCLLMLTFFLSCSENDGLPNELQKKETNIKSFKISDLPPEERAKLLGDLIIKKETSFRTAQTSFLNSVASKNIIAFGYQITSPNIESRKRDFSGRIRTGINQYYNDPITQNLLRLKCLGNEPENGGIRFLFRSKSQGEIEKLISYGAKDYFVTNLEKDELKTLLTSFHFKYMLRTIVDHKKFKPSKLSNYNQYLLPYIVYENTAYYIRNLEELQKVIDTIGI